MAVSKEKIKFSIAQKRWKNELARKTIDYDPYRPRKKGPKKKEVMLPTY
ncbi:hypothetical protein HVX29_19290 [Escherichia fergusonii]|nr:hypothetical protein [Escherichia fergusonii]QML71125.1 hypothetical protein HVX29_19290 [Escherichia fergusonii]